MLTAIVQDLLFTGGDIKVGRIFQGFDLWDSIFCGRGGRGAWMLTKLHFLDCKPSYSPSSSSL